MDMNLYQIKKEKFKSLYFSINYTMPAKAKEITENTVLASILSKTSQKWKTQEEIERYLSSLYGANFDVNVEKIGDLYNIEFRLECINKAYLPDQIDVVPDCVAFLEQIIYHPYLVDSKFDPMIVDREKANILNRIKQRKDDKVRYAISKTEEILTPGEPFGIYIYGEEDKISPITPGDLYKRYLSVLYSSCITVIISGNISGYDDMEQILYQCFGNKLDSKIAYTDLVTDIRTAPVEVSEIQEVFETQDTTQSVITMGMHLQDASVHDFFAMQVYNAVLGATPTSKLFQNFREKESLAYDVRSRYYRFKHIILIYAGIQKENYDRAKTVLMQELSSIQQGNITEIEFKAAKENLISDLLEWDDSKIALEKMLITNLFFYKNNDMTLENMIEGIRAITVQDVVNVANRLNLELVYLLGGEANA